MEIYGQHSPVIIELDELPDRKPDRVEYYRSATDDVLAADFGISDGVRRSESGGPFISSGFISISHSEKFLAVLVSDVPCGVDIQIPDRELNRGKDWFYNEQEQAIFGSEPTEDQLYRIWCAKEAFYKMKQGKMDDLRSDVSVSELQADCTVLLYHENVYTVRHSANDRYYLAYCFETTRDWK